MQISGSGDQHTNKNEDADTASHNRLVGLVAVLCAACTSGFSGVYFEKILKGSTTSLWLRNVQMGLPSIIIALITVFVKDSAAVEEQGFLGGYSPIVWTVVTVQAAGGLIVAVVVKYADNGKLRKSWCRATYMYEFCFYQRTRRLNHSIFFYLISTKQY